MKRCLIVSAHLDDAVLSAGQFIGGRPDTTVATILAGFPPDDVKITAYDRICGFKTSKDAIAVRRGEDAEALAYLKATPIHLDNLDSQYGERSQGAVIADVKWLIKELDPELVAAPLGVLHPDHIAVREAVLEAMRGREALMWLYEDLPNSVLHPEAVREALDALRASGYEAELGFVGTGPEASKLNAIWCYRSQMGLPEFDNRHCFLVPERFWQINKAMMPEAII